MACRHIVIVGPDGCGKSTLAAGLSRHLMLPTFHGSHADGSKLERMNDILLWGGPVILDRIYCIDEVVYNRVLGLPEPVQLKAFIKRVLNECLVIYVDNPDAYDILSQRGDDYVTPEHLADIRSNYMRLFNEYGHPSLSVINQFDRYDKILGGLVNELEERGYNVYR